MNEKKNKKVKNRCKKITHTTGKDINIFTVFLLNFVQRRPAIDEIGMCPGHDESFSNYLTHSVVETRCIHIKISTMSTK